jgi:hypothetical protein
VRLPAVTRITTSTLMADLWAIMLAVGLCGRLLFGSGYALARDVVFTPQQPVNVDSLGLGSSPARAVPLDAIIGLTEHVVDGTWLGRFAIFGVLAGAGCGIHRVAATWSLPARLVASGFAIWNPFVVERLALGQWALLSSYAAMPWLIRAVMRYRRSSHMREAAAIVGWLALASLTPTGGVIGSAAVLVIGLGRNVARSISLAVLAVALQLPWIVPSLINTSASTSDPAAVAAFAARAERFGGPMMSLLGLGGIWDADSTPASRAGPLGYITTLIVAAGVAVGYRSLRRLLGEDLVMRLTVLAVSGFAMAMASSIPVLDAVVRWSVRTLPGAGLIRDSQKWLMPFVVLAILCVAECIHVICAAARRSAPALLWLTGVVAAFLPLALLPDAIATTRDTMTPVRYPSDFPAVAQRIDRHGDVITLPLSAYRLFSWGRPIPVADPASRWFDNRVVVADNLVVGNTTLKGEDPRFAAIARASGQPLATVLARAGIRWAVVYLDAPGATNLSLTGLEQVFTGRYLALYRVPTPQLNAFKGPSGVAAAAVVVVDVAASCLVLLFMVGWPTTRLVRHLAHT